MVTMIATTTRSLLFANKSRTFCKCPCFLSVFSSGQSQPDSGRDLPVGRLSHCSHPSTALTGSPFRPAIYCQANHHSNKRAARSLSTTGGGLAAASELSSVLTREIDEEVDGETLEPPQDLSELKGEIETDWRIVDGGPAAGTTQKAITRMYKREAGHNGAKIMIEFHCQDTEETSGAGEMGVEESEDGEEVSPANRFTVYVSRAGKILVFDCVTEDSELVVEGVVMKDIDGGTEGAAGVGMHLDDKGDYQGPVFSELADDLQESLSNFVQEYCGVTENVCAFVAMYSDYREQVEYVNWMKSIQNMIE